MPHTHRQGKLCGFCIFRIETVMYEICGTEIWRHRELNISRKRITVWRLTLSIRRSAALNVWHCPRSVKCHSDLLSVYEVFKHKRGKYICKKWNSQAKHTLAVSLNDISGLRNDKDSCCGFGYDTVYSGKFGGHVYDYVASYARIWPYDCL